MGWLYPSRGLDDHQPLFQLGGQQREVHLQSNRRLLDLRILLFLLPGEIAVDGRILLKVTLQTFK